MAEKTDLHPDAARILKELIEVIRKVKAGEMSIVRSVDEMVASGNTVTRSLTLQVQIGARQ